MFSSSRRFSLSPSVGSLIGLCVLAVVICSGALLLFKYVQLSQEAARRDRCAKNLAGIEAGMGFAVNRYHEAQGSLPPSTAGPDQPTWAFFLWPYLEEPGRASTAGGTKDRLSQFESYDFSQNCFAEANAEILNGLYSRAFYCPTRRARSPAVLVEGLAAHPSDYACVGATNGEDPLGPKADSMLMAAELPDGKLTFNSIRSRTNFDSVTDGLSHTAMIGEKHIWSDGLRNPALSKAGGDGPVMLGRQMYFLRLMGTAVKRPLAQGPGDHSLDNQFGSWHPGVCLFLMGDNSVRTIHNNTDLRVLSLMGRRIAQE